MAVIKQGILGGFQNKVGSVIGSSWKGIAVMKAKPLSVANPRTVGQVQQRSKFGGLASFLSPMVGSICKPLWDRFAGQKSGYNAMLQANINNVNADGLPDGLNFVISRGKLGSTDFTANQVVGTPTSLNLEWDATPTGVQASTDQLYVLVWRETFTDFVAISQATTRNIGQFVVDITSIYGVGENYYVYLAFRRADGTAVGDSTAVLVTT